MGVDVAVGLGVDVGMGVGVGVGEAGGVGEAVAVGVADRVATGVIDGVAEPVSAGAHAAPPVIETLTRRYRARCGDAVSRSAAGVATRRLRIRYSRAGS